MSKALMTPYVCFCKRIYCDYAAKLLKICENIYFIDYKLRNN